MKIFFSILSLFFLFSFVDVEEIIFSSNNKKVSITADNTWKPKANMKGVELFISKKNKTNNSISTIVVSKDEGLLPLTSLEKYSASKIFLQTAVLKTTPQSAITKTINGIKMKVYEYDYSDSELNAKHSIVYHAIIGNSGYQLVVTANAESFELSRTMFNQIVSSLSIK